MTYEMSEREIDIRKRWNDGFSAGQIAAQTGQTRNAIVGIVAKLRNKGVAVRGVGKDKMNGGRLQRDIKAPQPAEALPPVVREEAPEEPKKQKLDPLADFSLRSIPFLDRQHLFRAPDQRDVPFDGSTRVMCQWPAWPLDDKTGPMCGASTDRHAASRYCTYHQKIAYNPRAKT